MSFAYQPKPIDKLRANYNQRVKGEKNGFPSLEDFLDWYQAEEKICHYCGLTEPEMQEIVLRGILISKRFPTGEERKRGQSRGIWLEVDRVQPLGQYNRNNCKLACYFCNNDKSDVFSGEMYKAFFQNRAGFLRGLLAGTVQSDTRVDKGSDITI